MSKIKNKKILLIILETLEKIFCYHEIPSQKPPSRHAQRHNLWLGCVRDLLKTTTSLNNAYLPSEITFLNAKTFN